MRSFQEFVHFIALFFFKLQTVKSCCTQLVKGDWYDTVYCRFLFRCIPRCQPLDASLRSRISKGGAGSYANTVKRFEISSNNFGNALSSNIILTSVITLKFEKNFILVSNCKYTFRRFHILPISKKFSTCSIMQQLKHI